MDLGKIIKYVNFILNKDQSGNTLNAEEFNMCLEYANVEYFRVLIGLPEQYQPGVALPKIAAEQTEKISSALRKFNVWLGAPNTDQLPLQKGLSKLPSDYVQYSAIMTETKDGKYTQVEVLTDQFIADRLQSVLKGPTTKKPIAHFYGEHVLVYPNTISRVHFKYYRLPKTPFYAVTIQDDNEIYDPSNSIQLEWPEIEINNIVPFILEYAASNLRDGFTYQNAVRRQMLGA
jgi:hypothetical protein